VFANAGVVDPVSLTESTPETFDKHFNLNARGAYFTVQKALPLLTENASIILSGPGAWQMGLHPLPQRWASLPFLRDVLLTGPYMHDGSLETLWDVVEFFNKGGERNPFLDAEMKPLGLTESEVEG
jgi:hypothetical protein